jgi:hypothetical protein
MKIKTTLYSLTEALLDSIEEEFPEWETWEQDEFARELISDLAGTGKLRFVNPRAGNFPPIHPLLLEGLAASS